MTEEKKPPLPWMQWEPGDRVVVRYRAEDGVHDALGTLVENSPHHVVIDAKRGRVRVEAHTMMTGRLVTKMRPVANPGTDRGVSSPQS